MKMWWRVALNKAPRTCGQNERKRAVNKFDAALDRVVSGTGPGENLRRRQGQLGVGVRLIVDAGKAEAKQAQKLLAVSGDI